VRAGRFQPDSKQAGSANDGGELWENRIAAQFTVRRRRRALRSSGSRKSGAQVGREVVQARGREVLHQKSTPGEYTPGDVFMVIERFKHGDPGPVGERFGLQGRMLPEEVTYHGSWVDTTGTRCFQIMEASNRESLDVWERSWEDLVEFEVVPVLRSAEFWADFWARKRVD
jgi:Protein of unknown function (DUF3303)